MEGLPNTPSITFARNYLYTRVEIDCSQPLYLRTSEASAKHAGVGDGVLKGKQAKKILPPPTQSSLPFSAGAQFSRDSVRSFNHWIK